jgi:hypothetical protein
VHLAALRPLILKIWPKIHFFLDFSKSFSPNSTYFSLFDASCKWFRIILPKNRKFLTEWPFGRNTIWPNTVWPKWHMPESSLDRKLFSKNGHLIERSFDRKFIWLKAFPILMINQGCFTFCKKLFRSNDNFWKKMLLVKWTFGQMIFRSNDLSV